METNRTTNTNPTNTDPEMEFSRSLEQRYRLAAAPCPEEFRAAYIHLLKELHADNMDIINENGDCPSPYEYFCLSVLTFLVNNPSVDPWDLAEIVDHHPDGDTFAGQLRVLSRLRHREHV